MVGEGLLIEQDIAFKAGVVALSRPTQLEATHSRKRGEKSDVADGWVE